MIGSFVSWLLGVFAAYKDGITVLIAGTLFVVGGYQYFEVRTETRIEKSLDILKRREQTIFVDARTVALKKWIDTKTLLSEFAGTETYSQELIEKITEEIGQDQAYRIALYNISTFYNNAAACALDGVCDIATLCASLHGEIQDYMEVNKGYMSYATAVRFEDAKSLTLSLPEFSRECRRDIGLNIFSRHDSGFWCRVNMFTYRRLSIGINSACDPIVSKYDWEVEEQAKKIRAIISPNNRS